MIALLFSFHAGSIGHKFKYSAFQSARLTTDACFTLKKNAPASNGFCATVGILQFKEDILMFSCFMSIFEFH